jgi:phosphatidylinositol alpha 1,6-mannosyltransferase
MLVNVQRRLADAGMEDCRFLVVGDGSERSWLQTNLRNCRLTGTLRGAELARAYAGMDAFIFPSEADTFGNVILEAMASGVPPLVAAGGGPKYLVQSGVNGSSSRQSTRIYRCNSEASARHGVACLSCR